MKEKDIRLLMEVSPDREHLPGLTRGVDLMRTKSTRAGKMLYLTACPIWDTEASREAAAALDKAKERRGTTQAQQKLNARNARWKLEQIINANFTDGDMLVGCTYEPDGQPADLAAAMKNMRNYMARLRRLCARRGSPPPRYVYVTETKVKKRGIEYHHHAVIHAEGITRDELEALWTKHHGICNTKRAQRQKEGLRGHAKYIAKQVCADGNAEEYTRRHRWCASKGLTIPVASTADKKLSRRRMEKIAQEIKRDPREAAALLEKINPGYEVVELEVKTSEWVTGAYVYAVMCRRDDGGESRSNRR